MNILAIDGDWERFLELKHGLRQARHRVDSVQPSLLADILEGAHAYDCILLVDSAASLTTLRMLRHDLGCRIPLITLSGERMSSRLIENLNNGADDYLAAPISPKELIARIRAKLRYCRVSDTKAADSCTDTRIDLDAFQIERDGCVERLTKQEHGVLTVLVRQRGQIVRKAALLAVMQQTGVVRNEDHLAAVICRLRKKLGRDRICTMRGAGYLLMCD